MDRMDTCRRPLAGVLMPLLGLLIAAVLVPGCGGRVYDPSQATRAYPDELSQGNTIQAEAYRDGAHLMIVNATPQSFLNFDVWVNQRYMHHIEALSAGETVRLKITDFFDVWGESPVPGGFFRSERPTPIILVQFQLDRTQPFQGLVTVPVNDEF